MKFIFDFILFIKTSLQETVNIMTIMHLKILAILVYKTLK